MNKYMLLGRIAADAKEFIEPDSFCFGKESRLFSQTVEEHIKDMKILWHGLKEKPEWLTWKQILTFETKMMEVKNGYTNK